MPKAPAPIFSTISREPQVLRGNSDNWVSGPPAANREAWCTSLWAEATLAMFFNWRTSSSCFLEARTLRGFPIHLQAAHRRPRPDRAARIHPRCVWPAFNAHLPGQTNQRSITCFSSSVGTRLVQGVCDLFVAHFQFDLEKDDGPVVLLEPPERLFVSVYQVSSDGLLQGRGSGIFLTAVQVGDGRVGRRPCGSRRGCD